MTAPSYSRNSPSQQREQLCEIQSVDLINLRAVGASRNSTNLPIDLRYYVGAAHVIPAPGDQWVVRWFGTSWILDFQLPFNTTELATIAGNPVKGLTQIGSTNPAGTGPTEINGSTINIKGPLNLNGVPTAGRPDAGTAGRGSIVFDTTLGEIILSDGTAWSPLGSGGGGGGTYATVAGEVPTGTKDGSNTVFIVGHNFRTASTELYRNGLRERLGVGYSESAGNTLTFTTAPLVDDDILVDYVLQ